MTTIKKYTIAISPEAAEENAAENFRAFEMTGDDAEDLSFSDVLAEFHDTPEEAAHALNVARGNAQRAELMDSLYFSAKVFEVEVLVKAREVAP